MLLLYNVSLFYGINGVVNMIFSELYDHIPLLLILLQILMAAKKEGEGIQKWTANADKKFENLFVNAPLKILELFCSRQYFVSTCFNILFQWHDKNIQLNAPYR